MTLRLHAAAALFVIATPGIAFADGQEPRGPEPEDVQGVAGMRGGKPYLRIFDDALRVYPGLRVRTDGTWSEVPEDIAPGRGDEDGGARLALRRLRLELSGEVFRQVAFTAGAEMGGQRMGQTPFIGPATRRWNPADAHDGEMRPAEVSISYVPLPWLAVTVGQVNVPFSLSNRTRETITPYLERPMPIAGFAVPDNKAVGAMIWGELDERVFAYEIGAFSGGSDQPVLQGNVDAVGRMFFRPLALAGDGVFFDLAQIGVSGRYGQRDPELVISDYPTIATGQGFALWQPGYVDALDRVTHVIPSGAQRSVGGELRLPFRTPTDAVFDISGEAYYVMNDTREAIDGAQATTTERLGAISGVGWYASIAWWACFIPGFEQLVTGEPGITRPVSLDDERGPAMASGLEVSVIAGGIHADYEGFSRQDSVADPNSPAGNIDIYQFGGAIQYWFGANLRAGVNYMAYFAPDSGDATLTQVVVPDNLPRAPDTPDGPEKPGGDGHLHHEVSIRLAATL